MEGVLGAVGLVQAEVTTAAEDAERLGVIWSLGLSAIGVLIYRLGRRGTSTSRHLTWGGAPENAWRINRLTWMALGFMLAAVGLLSAGAACLRSDWL